MNNTQVQIDGKWVQAKQEPYQPYGIEWVKCKLGLHEWVMSKKYAHTRVCFRCGIRKQSRKFSY